MMDRNIIILAGGMSSRMRSEADVGGIPRHHHEDASTRPKGMIRIGPGGRPFLDFLLYHIREAGYRDVVIVLGEGGGTIRERYGVKDKHNQFHGLQISYAVQPIPEGRVKPLGTADAVARALRSRPDWSGRKFTVCNSDNLYSVHVLAELLNSKDSGALIDYDRDALGMSRDRVEQFAVVMKDGEGYVTDIVEKPDTTTLRAAAGAGGRIGVSMNIFRLKTDLILPIAESLPLHSIRGERELPVAVGAMVHQYPKSIRAIPVSEPVPDLTSRKDIAAVEKHLETLFPDFSW